MIFNWLRFRRKFLREDKFKSSLLKISLSFIKGQSHTIYCSLIAIRHKRVLQKISGAEGFPKSHSENGIKKEKLGIKKSAKNKRRAKGEIFLPLDALFSSSLCLSSLSEKINKGKVNFKGIFTWLWAFLLYVEGLGRTERVSLTMWKMKSYLLVWILQK